jgi:uncharacterized membrane protein
MLENASLNLDILSSLLPKFIALAERELNDPVRWNNFFNIIKLYLLEFRDMLNMIERF